MVQSNQILFTGAISIVSLGDFPSNNITFDGPVTVRGVNNDFIEPSVSIFDSNGNPIVKPGDIFVWYAPSFGQATVIGYNNSGWIQLDTGISPSISFGKVCQKNENPGNAVFVNGFAFGTGTISVTLIDDSVIGFNIDGVSNYVLPVIAKGIDNTTVSPMNGVYALY